MWLATLFTLALAGSSDAVPLDLALSLNSTSNGNHSVTSTSMTSDTVTISTEPTFSGTNNTDIIPSSTSYEDTSSLTSATSTIVSSEDPTSQPTVTSSDEQTTEPDTSSTETDTDAYPAVTITPLHEPVPEPITVPGGSHIPCPCPWYMWYLNWLCDDDPEVEGIFLAVSPNAKFPWPQPPGVNPIAGFQVISGPPPWEPPLEIDNEGLPKEPERPEDPDDCEPETTTLEYEKEFETISVSDSVTSTIMTATTKSIETTLPCSLTTTGEDETSTTIVSSSTPGPSCPIVTPTSPIPADPTDWPGPPETDKTLDRRDQPCDVIDFVIYPKSTDNQDEHYKSLVSWLDVMSDKADEDTCDYVIAESAQINFVAFIYVHNCSPQWLAFFNKAELESAVEIAYDWLDYASLNDPSPLPSQPQSQPPAEKRSKSFENAILDFDFSDDYVEDGMTDFQDSSGIISNKLVSRELQIDYWEQFWEFGQIAVEGPAWLRDPDVYVSIDNEPAYNYVHDDLDGKGQTIYIVDSLVDPDHSEFENLSDDEDEPRIEPLVLGFEFGATKEVPLGHHGTSVAALAGGNTLGIAKRSTIVVFPGKQGYEPDPRRAKRFIANAEYYLHGVLAVLDDIVEHGEARHSSILNLSWGQLKAKVPEAYGERMRLLLKKLADDYNVLIVCAAGNSRPGRTVSEDTYPQAFAQDIGNMILAGASDKNTYRAGFSLKNNMDVPILYAPGMFVARPEPISRDSVVLDHGTSFAAPKIAGLAAYIQAWAVEEQVSINPIKDILFDLANLRELEITETDAQVPYGSTKYPSTNEVVHPIFNGGICFAIPRLMDEDYCSEIKEIVVKAGSQSERTLGVRGNVNARADNEPPQRNIIGINPDVDDGPILPGEPTAEIEPVPPATYPDLIPTTWTDQPGSSSTISSTEATSAPPTTSPGAPPTTVSTESSSISASSTAPSSTSTVEPPPTTTTEQPPEPTETEPPPPPFNPGICRAHVTEFGLVEGVMAKITLYDDADVAIGDNSDTVDFDFDGNLDSGWDPIDWDGQYWIYSDALGLNTSFTFMMGIVEKRQDSFLAFTRWNIMANVGDQVEWDLSALDEESFPHVSLGGWTYDGSEPVIPANEASIRDMDFRWECNWEG